MYLVPFSSLASTLKKMEACEAKTLRESKSDKQFGGPGTRKRNAAVHQRKVLQELAVNATTKTGQEGKIVEEVAE